MSLSTALSIFLPVLAGVAGGGGGTPAKKGDTGGSFLSDAASAFLDLSSDKAKPFQYPADAPLRNRTIQELTRGNIYGRQPTQSVPGGPVRFDYANNTQLARVMRNLQDNATNSQVKELMYAYASPVQPEDTSTGAGQVKMTEVNIR